MRRATFNAEFQPFLWQDSGQYRQVGTRIALVYEAATLAKPRLSGDWSMMGSERQQAKADERGREMAQTGVSNVDATRFTLVAGGPKG